MDVWASRAIVDIEAIHSVVKPYAEEAGLRKCQGTPRKRECGMLRLLFLGATVCNRKE
jgi:hypothetical protein